jgi:hypothetical protein
MSTAKLLMLGGFTLLIAGAFLLVGTVIWTDHLLGFFLAYIAWRGIRQIAILMLIVGFILWLGAQFLQSVDPPSK